MRLMDIFQLRSRAPVCTGPTPDTHWLNPENYNPRWIKRARAVVPWLAGYSAVCDIGCGPHQVLRKVLPRGLAYYPADLAQWTPDTEVCDLNTDWFPLASLERSDVCVLLGLVERLRNPQAVFLCLSRHVTGIVFSYHPEGGPHFANQASEAVISQMLEAAGFEVTARKLFRRTQALYHARRTMTRV